MTTLFQNFLAVIILLCFVALVWNLIPDGFKKFWKYQRSLRRDKKKGRRRKYTISFR